MLNRFIADSKKYYKYAVYSSKAELKSEIANSHLSWLWWILDPFLFMCVYSFIAVIVFDKGEKYFIAFVFIGLTCWDFFNKTVKQSVKLVSSNKQIVTKVYIPKFILIVIKMGVNGFKMVISFTLVLVMMLIYRVPLNWHMLLIIPIFLTLFLLTFGASAILLHFGVFVEDLSNVINVLLRLVFYLSGIFYSIVKNVNAPYNEILLLGNPMALIINDMREALLYNSSIHVVAIFAWFLVSLLFAITGLNLIYKYENSYVKVI
ncbi:MAG: ABC transporter permease [Lachnospiraceae bacterium]